MADLRFRLYGASAEPLSIRIQAADARGWLEQCSEWMRNGDLMEVGTRAGDENVVVNFAQVWAVEHVQPGRMQSA